MAYYYGKLKLEKKGKINANTHPKIYQAIEEFNLNNNFTKEKCRYLPFLVAIGNGQKQTLLGAFENSFDVDERGFYVDNLEIESFLNDVFDGENRGNRLMIKMDNDIHSHEYTNIISAYGDEEEDGIYEGIKTSIDNIHSNLFSDFALRNEEDIIFWNKSSSVLYDLYINKKNNYFSHYDKNELNEQISDYKFTFDPSYIPDVLRIN